MKDVLGRLLALSSFFQLACLARCGDPSGRCAQRGTRRKPNLGRYASARDLRNRRLT